MYFGLRRIQLSSQSNRLPDLIRHYIGLGLHQCVSILLIDCEIRDCAFSHLQRNFPNFVEVIV